MSREQLTAASETLRATSEDVANEAARERLTDQADQLAKLADGERGPDHGRLARHENALAEIKALLGPEHEGKIDEALNQMRAYRETVEGI